MARVRLVPLVLSLAVVSLQPVSPSAQSRLVDESDRAAFRGWFVLLADAAFYRPVAEVSDCAALVRYAAREALRAHTPEWLRLANLTVEPGLPEIASRPLAAADHVPLFRVSGDPRSPLAEFADAQTLIRYNARFVARDAAAARPGDLLYYHQPSQREPDHLMIYIGPSRYDVGASDFVVYHTGPDEHGPGEMRKVRLTDLLRHPSLRWRPLAANHTFVGVFRLTLQ